MKLKIVLTNIIFLFLGYILYAQEIPKDTIYLDFNFYKKNCTYKDLTLKQKEKNGIQFNLCGEAILFTNLRDTKPDTLCYKHLKNYKVTDLKEVDRLNKNWFVKNKDLLTKKYGKYPPKTNNKNGHFTTYLIEKHSDYFVIYSIYWRNQINSGGFIVIEP